MRRRDVAERRDWMVGLYLRQASRLTLIHEQLPDEEARQSHEQGWSGLLDKLLVFLGDAE